MNDPQSLILLKVFPDNQPESIYHGNHDDSSQFSDLTSTDGKSTRTFCLRFGSIAITPGTSVRRNMLNASSAYTFLRFNCSMDACHLSSSERGCCWRMTFLLSIMDEVIVVMPNDNSSVQLVM